MSSEMSGRPDIGQILMEAATMWARRSSCVRSQVGAVIAIKGRMVSSGYNGAPAGMPHCEHPCTCHSPPLPVNSEHHTLQCHILDPCTISVHAEANAIAFAARHGVALEGSTLYTTHSPCVSCAQLIINAGIVEVNYLYDYRITDGRVLLSAVGIDTHQYHVID